MPEDTQAKRPEIKLLVEAVDASTLGEATISKLTVIGASDTVSVLASVVLELVGGVVEKAVSIGPDGEETEITRDFVSPERVDILDTGDDSVEA